MVFFESVSQETGSLFSESFCGKRKGIFLIGRVNEDGSEGDGQFLTAESMRRQRQPKTGRPVMRQEGNVVNERQV